MFALLPQLEKLCQGVWCGGGMGAFCCCFFNNIERKVLNWICVFVKISSYGLLLNLGLKLNPVIDICTFLLWSAFLSFSSISSLVRRELFFFLLSNFLRCWGLLFTLPVSGHNRTSNAIPPLLCGLSVTPPTGASELILFLTSSCFSEKETLFSFKLFLLGTWEPSIKSSVEEKIN